MQKLVDLSVNKAVDADSVESITIVNSDAKVNCIKVMMQSGESHLLNVEYGFTVYGTYDKLKAAINAARMEPLK